MKDRNISVFVNHTNRTFALSTRRETESRLEELIDVHKDNGYDHAFVARNLNDYQAKAGIAVVRAAYESACGYTYQSLRQVSK